ncbi:hypothetical protein [Bacillus coahuilensis]|uniref:hypothetical protein n=1 Tax=Bacillus coahuilensis TaxID=408580 RepID=UPI0001851172|nr:hypothetical protein [Bacillus coahuilensis]
MARNPFLQLDVLHNRYKMNKPLTDCYRLIFHRKLWSTLFSARKEEEIESSWLHCLSKKGRLYTAKKLEDTYLYSVVTYTLSQIFIPHETSHIYVLQGIKNWKEVTHFLTGTISSLTPKVLQHKVDSFLQATIQDSKFNQLVMRLLKWTRQSSASKEVKKFLSLCERLALLQLDKEMRIQFERIGIHAYYVRYDVDVLIGFHGKEKAFQENPFLSLPIQFSSHRKKKRVDFLQHRITAVRKANEEISRSHHLIQITIPKLELIQFSKKYGTLQPFRSKHRPI